MDNFFFSFYVKTIVRNPHDTRWCSNLMLGNLTNTKSLTYEPVTHGTFHLRRTRVVPLGSFVVKLHRREVRIDGARRWHAHCSAVVQVGAKTKNIHRANAAWPSPPFVTIVADRKYTDAKEAKNALACCKSPCGLDEALAINEWKFRHAAHFPRAVNPKMPKTFRVSVFASFHVQCSHESTVFCSWGKFNLSLARQNLKFAEIIFSPVETLLAFARYAS